MPLPKHLFTIFYVVFNKMLIFFHQQVFVPPNKRKRRCVQRPYIFSASFPRRRKSHYSLLVPLRLNTNKDDGKIPPLEGGEAEMPACAGMTRNFISI